MGKSARLLTLPRKTNPSLVKELKHVPEPSKSIFFQGTLLFKGVKRMRCIRSRRIGRRKY